MSFHSFGLHAGLMRGVADQGFMQATPIQQSAIPAGMSGRDVLACAATGSGKTAAFLLPILNRLLAGPRGRTRALIVTPTRELAVQIDEHARKLARHTSLRSAAVYGGVGMEPQRRALQGGTDIIVATPGRLLDHLRFPYARLKHVEALVLDEADRMLDMGFLPDIRRILNYLPATKQVFFFSATMPPEIERLAREMLRDPVAIDIKRQGRPAARVAQRVFSVAHLDKPRLLAELVRHASVRNALVFTRTKRRADRVAEYLNRHQVPAERIHGDRSQSQRTQALESFKRGRFRVMVATDVAARGIDIHALSHVINFDTPGSVDDYIHRIGRTARAEAEGEAITFVTPEDEPGLRAIERRLAKSLPRTRFASCGASNHEPSRVAEDSSRRHRRSKGPKRRRRRVQTPMAAGSLAG